MVDREEENFHSEGSEREIIRRRDRSRSVEARRKAEWIGAMVWFAFGSLIGSIGIRFILKLIAANPANAFTNLVYAVTGLFMAPFINITAIPATSNGMVFEFPDIIAMLVYALIGWAVERVVWLLIVRD